VSLLGNSPTFDCCCTPGEFANLRLLLYCASQDALLHMRLARQLTQCLETEDLRGGADSYPLGLYCSWTRSEWQWCLNVLVCDLLGHMFVKCDQPVRQSAISQSELAPCCCQYLLCFLLWPVLIPPPLLHLQCPHSSATCPPKAGFASEVAPKVTGRLCV
jgi:hypothetical protein